MRGEMRTLWGPRCDPDGWEESVGVSVATCGQADIPLPLQRAQRPPILPLFLGKLICILVLQPEGGIWPADIFSLACTVFKKS